MFSWKSSDGLDLYAQSWRPDNTPQAMICVVHGLGEHSGRYAHMATYMNNAQYGVVSFDLRGHGRSGGTPGHSPSYQTLMGDITDFLRKIREEYPKTLCFLYGHSLGGNLVLNYAMRENPKLAGLIASSPGLIPTVKPPSWKLTAGRVLYHLCPKFTMTNGLDLQGLSRDLKVLQACQNDALVHTRISARLGLDILEAGQWVLEHAQQFPPLPLLLMHGDADRLTSFSASQLFAEKLNDRCTFKQWNGFYHELHNEPQKEEVFAFMLNWIKQHSHATSTST